MSENVVTLCRLEYGSARLLCSMLEAAGIENFIENVHVLQAAVFGGVKVEIREKDLSLALKIMDEFQEKQSGSSRSWDSTDIPGRILFPLAYPFKSEKALDFARSLAVPLDATICFCHSFRPPTPAIYDDSYTFQLNMDNLSKKLEKEARAFLDRFVEGFMQKNKEELKNGLSVESSLLIGPRDKTILRLSEAWQPDLIVLSSKKEKAGNVISKLVREAECPILIIPEDSVHSAIDSIKNVVYITEFDSSDFRAIWKLMGLVVPFGLGITCLHYGDKVPSSEDYSRMEHLRYRFSKSFRYQRLECQFAEGKPTSEKIRDFAIEKDAGILSISSHKKNMIERLLFPDEHDYLLKTGLPVLIFPSRRSD